MHLLYQFKQKVHPHDIAHSTHQKLLFTFIVAYNLKHFKGTISNRTHDWDSGSYNKHAERDLKEFQDFNFF